MARGPSRPYPAKPVDEVAKLADCIRAGSNSGDSMNRILLADALKKGAGSSEFRDLVAASAKFGFTKGNFNSDNIQLTELGEQLTQPRHDPERLAALRKGINNIPLFEKLLQHFKNRSLPESDFLKNTLERDPFNVPREWASEAADVFAANGKAVGYIRNVGGSQHVILEAGPPTLLTTESNPPNQPEPDGTLLETLENSASGIESVEYVGHSAITPQVTQQSPPTLQFFIAHGHDLESVQQVQKILDKLGIPYMIAAEEANVGRPISQKVKELMDACSGGIFIFSADEEFKDKDGNTIFRPRENVIYELGAASYVYDQRIVIFKEQSVTFPSDFSDLGYIEFEKGQLAGKTMELLTELIALKAIKLLPGG